MNRLKEILARMAEIEAEVRAGSLTAEQIEERNKEVDALATEKAAILAKEASDMRSKFANAKTVETTPEDDREIEERARALRQGRSVTVSNLDLLAVTHQDANLVPAFNEVSNLLSVIPTTQFDGGESHKVGYVEGYDEADYTVEGTAAHEVEPSFGYVEITKAKITAYTEVSEETEKLKPAMYLAEVKKNLTISMSKKLIKEMISGAGGSNALVGIFAKAKTTAIDAAKDLEIAAITDTTLDDIIYAYGGNEDFSEGVLILNKATLKEFDTLKDKQGKKFYRVDRNMHTIDGVPYVIASAVKPFSTAATGEYFLAYGSPINYRLDQFSPIEMSKSTDYKFKEGMIAYKAVGFFGGNVCAHNGFIRAKKKAAA